MKLRGVDFGPIWCASGAMGFFGEGYWYHRWLKLLGLGWQDCTFVAKTTTLHRRTGNMPLRGDCISPTERKPRCIVVKWREGVVLNAVGLSGPGAYWLFDQHRWQALPKPFFLSFMSVEKTPEERLEELEWFVSLFRTHLRGFHSPVGLQLNFSCPNVGLKAEALAREVEQALAAASTLGIPLVPKFNITIPPGLAKYIAENEHCDALCVSNTIPWGQLPDKINWKQLFGTDESPLKDLGGGGLSGWPLLPLVADWIREARAAGLSKPINAGGGILGPRDVQTLWDAGASSVFIGSVAMLRWWRMRRIIRRAQMLFDETNTRFRRLAAIVP